jgi:hypothetical protein
VITILIINLALTIPAGCCKGDLTVRPIEEKNRILLPLPAKKNAAPEVAAQKYKSIRNYLVPFRRIALL